MHQRKSFRYYVAIVLLLWLPIISCGPQYKAAKEQKRQEKRIEERRIAGERTLSDGKKRHLNTQSKETRKRMKQSRRQSERLNKNKKIPFYKRWFNAIKNR